MKHLLVVIFITLAITGCRNENENEEMPAVNDEQLDEVAYSNYGATINKEDTKGSGDLTYLYANLKPNDSVDVKVKTVITEVCANKGCWIEIPVGDDQMARVTFKNYGFFLPKNSQGKQVILEGKAYKSTTSKEDLKHYAMDGGKSQAEIDAITQDEVTLSFEATGALVETYENMDVIIPADKKAE